MKITFMTVIFCFSSALVDIHSLTPPYVRFMATNLPNHSYVDLTVVGGAGDGSDSVQCHTDLSIHAVVLLRAADRGDWHCPNGSQSRLPFLGFGNVYEDRGAQRVDLRRKSIAVTSEFGVYHCTVETNAVHSDDGSVTTKWETVYA